MKKKIYILTSLLLFIALAAASAAYLLVKPGFVYHVYLDGEFIGTVSEMEEYTGILSDMLTREEARVGLSLTFAEDVSARREFQWQPEADCETVKAILEANISYITIGWGIFVDDECLAWTAAEQDAQAVLDRVAGHYVSESSNRKLVATEIVDDVEICSGEVLPEDIIDVDSAVALIVQGREKIETYTVTRGDSIWSIARSANISQAELREANPSLAESSILYTGQVLNLVKAEPKISVRTIEHVFAQESISFSTTYQNSSNLWYYQSKTVQSGSKGKREVTYEVEFLNGEEVKRKAIDSKVISQPVTRIVQRGTSRWPSQATGMFRWPLNSGKITDRFGAFQYWRNERHRAVDIGAARGTAIYAAASGTVTAAAYNSSYGNYVVIEHNNGYSTLYAHADTLLVREGQRVSKGDLIGRVGSTGFSTGPHLHFEVRRHGTPVDPLQFFKP